ncbi:hypothetical protein RJ639_011148, partial [Escallonia herrerae]
KSLLQRWGRKKKSKLTRVKIRPTGIESKKSKGALNTELVKSEKKGFEAFNPEEQIDILGEPSFVHCVRAGGPTKRSSPKRIEGPDGRNLQLHFRSRLSLPLFTGGKVEGEQGAAIHIVLVDSNTGHVVTSGSESSAKLDVVVLEGDFNNEDDEDWSKEEFEGHIVKEREGKRPLLTGDLQVALREGVGTLGDITFTDNSSWIRSRKFRLGLKVVSGSEGVRLREAKTEAFTVKDHRGELYKKHYPPALNDEVWRLEKIGKDGSFHKRLNKAGIFTVEDFLRLVVRDPQKLRNILGSGMSNKMWDALIEHAKTCVLSGKLYVYYPDDTRNVGVVFNNIYELSGLIARIPTTELQLQKAQFNAIVSNTAKAYENWNQVVEYDGKSLLSFKQPKKPSQNELPIGSLDYSNPVNNHLLPPRMPISVSLETSSMDPSLLIGDVRTGIRCYPTKIPLPVSGYEDSLATRFPTQSQLVSCNTRSQFDSSSHDQQVNQSARYNNRIGLALGHSQSSSFQTAGPSIQQPNLNPFEEWSHNRDKSVEDFVSEDEIRIRSHEMLENEDMQHLLRLFSLGGHASVSVPDDGFAFPSYMPSPSSNFSYDEDRNRSGKAVVGWLKIKAAMRWGFFVRKKAAERRAQIIELEDE